MVRVLGTSPSVRSTPKEIERVGKAVGKFSALLFDKFGMIHNDICNGNIICSPQNGPVGVIDIASAQKSTCPEEMFLTPLLTKPNFSPYIAAEFERLTGREIDFSVVCELDQKRRAALLGAHPKEIAKTIQETLDSNLSEWKKTLSESSNCTRPLKMPHNQGKKHSADYV